MYSYNRLTKKRSYFYAILFSIMICQQLLISGNSIAQKSSVQVSIFTGITPKASVAKTEGEYSIRSTPQAAWEAGIDYRYQAWKSISILAGLRGALTGRSAIFNVPAREINPAYPDPYPPIKIKEYDFNIAMPLLIEKEWRRAEKEMAFLQTGLKFHYSLGFDQNSVGNYFTDTNQTEINVFSLDLNTNNNKKPWISCSLGGGYGWQLKNDNIIRAGVMADISFSNNVRGTYQVNLPGHPVSSGTYKARGSYIGLFASYQFTGGNKKTPYSFDAHKPDEGNHISITFSALTCLPAKLESTKGSYPVSASVSPGFGLGVIYQVHLNEHYSINAGFEATAVGRNFIARFNREDYSPQLKESVALKGMNTYLNDFVLSVPVSLERRYFISDRNFFQVELGGRLNYSTGADLDIQEVSAENINSERVKLAQINTYANNDARPWVSGLLKAGYNRVLKNNNITRLSLVSNISFTRFVNGAYVIRQGNNKVSEGIYSSSGSFVGIALSYIFTSARYRFRK